MLNRSHKNEEIRTLESIAKKYGVLDLGKELDTLCSFRDTYVTKIVFMGSFNAGKSALINKFIGRNVLIEAQKPQTTIATELHYTDREERITAKNTQTGETADFSIQEQEHISSDKFDMAIMYLKNDIIKALGDAVVVDMPGYDSGIVNHNKAITKYIGESMIYFYIKPVSLAGGLSDGDLGHIVELFEYSGNVALLMNQTDLLNDDKNKLDEISEKVKDSLEQCFLDLPVYYLSKKDEDIQNKLLKIIFDFNTQAVFDRNLSKMISSMASGVKEQLELLVKNVVSVDNEEYKQKILALEKQKKSVEEEFERKKSSGKSSLLTEGVERICSEINSGLDSCRGRLISAVKNGASSETLSSIIAETVRPIINREVSVELSRQINDIANSVCAEIKCEETPELSQLLVGLAEKTKGILESDTLYNFAKSVDKMNSMKDKLNAGKTAYIGTAGVLAAATSVLAPPVEIVIILLPEIIQLGQLIFGRSPEEKIAELLDNSYLPDIRRKLRDSIEDHMSKSYDTMLTALSKEFAEKTETITAQIREINENKHNEEQKLAAYAYELRCDIESINKIIERN